MEHGLNPAVYQVLISQNAVRIEQVKLEQTSLAIKDFVVEHHVDVEVCEWVLAVTKTGQLETAIFIACVMLIKENVCSGQAFVSILGGVIDAMVVIPERMHRLLDIAALSDVR